GAGGASGAGPGGAGEAPVRAGRPVPPALARGLAEDRAGDHPRLRRGPLVGRPDGGLGPRPATAVEAGPATGPAPDRGPDPRVVRRVEPGHPGAGPDVPPRRPPVAPAAAGRDLRAQVRRRLPERR